MATGRRPRSSEPPPKVLLGSARGTCKSVLLWETSQRTVTAGEGPVAPGPVCSQQPPSGPLLICAASGSNSLMPHGTFQVQVCALLRGPALHLPSFALLAPDSTHCSLCCPSHHAAPRPSPQPTHLFFLLQANDKLRDLCGWGGSAPDPDHLLPGCHLSAGKTRSSWAQSPLARAALPGNVGIGGAVAKQVPTSSFFPLRRVRH